MSTPLRLLIVGLALTGPARSAEGQAATAPQAAPAFGCPGLPAVQVQAVQTADAEAVCAGAVRAWAFMAQAGLRLPAQAMVQVVERLPGELDGRALGCYERATGRVLLLSRAAFDAAGGWFGQPPDAELYRSAATHELAHAVVGCQAGGATLPVPAHEYAAYVVTFATMAPALRAQVLARYPAPAFDSTLQINSLVYIGAPLQFAASAWRHYLTRRDGPSWLRALVAGELVQDLPSDGP